MTKSPTLYRLAADRQYDRIPDRIHSNPDDLFWTDRYGSTALHILCQARTVDRKLLKAVDAMVRPAPFLVSWPNVASWTPLHFAVEKRLVCGGPHPDTLPTALILRLIKACPTAVSIRTQGVSKSKTPFHIACEADADYSVLEAMLRINPALSTEPWVQKDVYNTVAENPLSVLWKQYSYHAAGSIATTTSSSSAQHHHHHHYRIRTKQKMALLLQAAYCKSVNNNYHHHHHHRPVVVGPTSNSVTTTTLDQSPSHIVASTISSPYDDDYHYYHQQYHHQQYLHIRNQQQQQQHQQQQQQQQHFRQVSPTTADEPDTFHDSACRSFRLLNAACCVRCPRDYFSQVLSEASLRDIYEPDEDGLLPLHYAVQHAHADSQPYTQFVVESLLHVAPHAAAATDPLGRLPLHMAVSDTLLTWHKGGVKELVWSYPSALRQIDPVTGLVPFLASATAATQSRLHLSTTYELLLAAPEMVHPWKWMKPNSHNNDDDGDDATADTIACHEREASQVSPSSSSSSSVTAAT